MAYEFTKLKLATERKARVKRLVVSGLAACAGLAFGIANNDMQSLFGIFFASATAMFPAIAVYYLMT
ncbi:hypothetical protein LJR129_005063 [Acidovorax sp. LjRoot129]|uniref:hypothetical protein n=1 Tax=unclassified Acidovorax TaxID=2684926 RepID=UPI003ECC6FCE